MWQFILAMIGVPVLASAVLVVILVARQKFIERRRRKSLTTFDQDATRLAARRPTGLPYNPNN